MLTHLITHNSFDIDCPGVLRLLDEDHHSRIDWHGFENTAPTVLATLRSLGQAVDDSGLEIPLTELTKLRASARDIPCQTRSGCRLARGGCIFGASARAALAWTEALTLMAGNSVSETAYAELAAQFSETEITFLTAAVGAINAWNRIAGAMKFAPPIPSERSASGVGR